MKSLVIIIQYNTQMIKNFERIRRIEFEKKSIFTSMLDMIIVFGYHEILNQDMKFVLQFCRCVLFF